MTVMWNQVPVMLLQPGQPAATSARSDACGAATAIRCPPAAAATDAATTDQVCACMCLRVA
jgi:hypothetical protein